MITLEDGIYVGLEPERYFAADRLGSTDPTVLEYVEQTADPDRRGAVVVTLIDGLFPAASTVLPLDRRGGNVLAVSRVRDGSRTATATIAVGAGSEGATITAAAQSSRLIMAGFPRLCFGHAD